MSFAQKTWGIYQHQLEGVRGGDASEHLISTDLLPSNWRPLEGAIWNERTERETLREWLKCCKKQLPETHSGFKRRPGPVEAEKQDNKQE